MINIIKLNTKIIISLIYKWILIWIMLIGTKVKFGSQLLRKINLLISLVWWLLLCLLWLCGLMWLLCRLNVRTLLELADITILWAHVQLIQGVRGHFWQILKVLLHVFSAKQLLLRLIRVTRKCRLISYRFLIFFYFEMFAILPYNLATVWFFGFFLNNAAMLQALIATDNLFKVSILRIDWSYWSHGGALSCCIRCIAAIVCFRCIIAVLLAMCSLFCLLSMMSQCSIIIAFISRYK